MPSLEQNLILDRCPHCNVNHPNLTKVTQCETNSHDNTNKRVWFFYKCAKCGGIVTATSHRVSAEITQIFPSTQTVNEDIPSPAKDYLEQAMDTVHAASGSIMLSASSVDAMLKLKGYESGKLYSRINKAVRDNLITKEMAEWAHRVRLDANGQRHADNEVGLPSMEDAQQTLEFVKALAQFLFVLPARVNKGLKESSSEND